MQLSAKARLVSLIVALVFMAGTLIGSGTYLIINHINNANATTETTLSVSGNLYNTNGTINTSAVTDFLNKLDFVTSGGTYTSPQIADNAGVTATNSFIFQMGYYVSPSGVMDTSKPITWQAVYARNGYLTIWMIQNYTVGFFNCSSTTITITNNPFVGYTTRPSYVEKNNNYSKSMIRDSTNNIYDLIAAKLNNFSTIVRSPKEANATWQATQTEDVYTYSSLFYDHHNGLQSYSGKFTGWAQSLWDSANPPYNDKFWIPSSVEIFNQSSSGQNQNNGLWGLSATDRAFSTIRLDTGTSSSSSSSGYSNYCWLRSGYSNNNRGAMRVVSSGSANGGGVSTGYGVRPAAHLSLSALEDALPPQYTISVTSNNQTYGTVSTNGGTYYEGSTLSVTATPNPHYQFVRWERNGVQVSTSPTYEITVSGNTTYTAVFEPIMYTVTTDVNITEAGTVSGGGSYQQGTQATLTASANNGYKFVGWDTNRNNQYDSGEPTVNPYRFTVTGNALVTAIFEKLPTITITTNNENYGKILYNNFLITSTQVIQDSGTQITNIYAIPVGGYAFLYWEDSQGFRSTANPLTYTISADTTLTAVFGKSVDGVVVTASTGGEARIVGFDDVTITDNDTVTLIAVTYTGYTFAGWYIDGELLNADYGTSAQIKYGEIKDKVVTAIFTPISNLGDMNSQTDNGQIDDFI